MPRLRKAAPRKIHQGSLSTVLHIGASSISMYVAQRDENGTFAMVDYLDQPAPIASDIFSTGNVAPATTERIISIIRSFQNALQELGLPPESITRTVGTNILAEARNLDAFANRIRVACGVTIETVDDGEMTRLIYTKTRRRLLHLPEMTQGHTLVVHVGPGNTRALLFHDGLITRYTSYRMGTHRTREAVDGSHAEGDALLRVIRQHVKGNLEQLRVDYEDITPKGLVVIGAEVQSVSSYFTTADSACKTAKLRVFTAGAAKLSDLELVKRFQLDYQTAEALLPALEINLAIAEIFGLERVHIPRSDYEQGLLNDILASSQVSDAFADEVIRSARILAERYQSDPRHGEHVANISRHLFEELADLHSLGPHEALLLQVAAILHEIGTFVSPRSHHKHSEYLILHSEVFGLDRQDVTLVALIARYHRHACPSPDHPGYAALDQENRILVCKLAALLRVADALERTHAQRVSQIEIVREPSRLRLRLPGLGDTAVERLAMASKGDLFERTFGLSVSVDPGN